MTSGGFPGGFPPPPTPPNTYFQYFLPHRLLQSKSGSRNSLFYPTEVNVSRWAGRCPHNPNTVSHSPVEMCSEECRSVSPQAPTTRYAPSPTPAGELSMLRSSFQTSTKGKLLLQQAGPVQPAAERRLLTLPPPPPPNLLHHPPSPFGFPCLTLDERHPCQTPPPRLPSFTT